MTARPDSLGMLDAAMRLPERTEQALLLAQDAALPSAEDASSIVIIGAGTAGLAARTVAFVAASAGNVATMAVTDTELPTWVSTNSLCIVIDHGESSNAICEAVDKAASLGAAIIATAIVGDVHARVERAGGSVVTLDACPAAPRAAWGPLCAAPLVVLDRLGFLPGLEPALDHAIQQLRHRRDAYAAGDDAPLRLARRIGRSIPLVTGGGSLGALAAARWKQQCNVNAKIPAFASALPELLYDEIAGWGQHGDVTRQVLTSVLLRHDYERAEIRDAFDRLVPALEESLLAVHVVVASGRGPLAQLFDLFLQADMVSLELAAQEGLDPGPAPALAYNGHQAIP